MTADGSDRSFGAPRFDVVLRGYDRRQVDEHLSRLQRLMGRMRTDLDAARSQVGSPIGPPTPAGGRPRPTPWPRTGGNDVVDTFTDRMHAILKAAEEEAAEIRDKARAAVRADEERAAALRAAVRVEEETARTTLADLVRQRDAVLAELTRVRGQLEGLLAVPTTRITLPTQESGPDRREAGAGQPLPGTPEPPEPVAVPSGVSSAPVPGAGGPAAPRTATGTAVFAAPGGLGEPASDESEPPAAERTTVVSPAEETALMGPLSDGPDESAAGAGPLESTQKVPVRDGDDGGAGDLDDEERPAPAEAPTQVTPASPARSG